jgi:signal transduction histidine kinase
MTNDLAKSILIAALLAGVSVLHFSGGGMLLHDVHRELYFVPILLGAYWFGLKGGVAVSTAASLLYLVGFLVTGMVLPLGLVILQISVFILVAVLLGGLENSRRRRQRELMAAERMGVLGNAAAAIGHELKGTVDALRKLHVRGGGLAECLEDEDFCTELRRMDNLVEALSGVAVQKNVQLLSVDVNDVAREAANLMEEERRSRKVHFDFQLDEAGCPSPLDKDSTRWAVSRLIENALDFAPAGSRVTISMHRGGDACSISVRDEGPGVKPEHRDKIFTPFFSTRQGGGGLALAGARKSIRSLGGDITFESRPGEGAEFTVTIPREAL